MLGLIAPAFAIRQLSKMIGGKGMALLTTSQLTFYDLKDAYHVEINPDCIVINCDGKNVSKEPVDVNISYGVYCGSTRVPGTAVISDTKFSVTIQNCTSTADGLITFTIPGSTDLSAIDSIHIKFSELNDMDNDIFIFDKYITFIKNVPGEIGRGIKEVKEYYCTSSSSTIAPTSGWDTGMPTMDNTNKYLWNYEETIYTDGDVINTMPVIIGVYGEGRGIASVINYYLATSEKNGVTVNTFGWTSQVQEMDDIRKYLWNYEEITYTSGNPTRTDPVIIGIFSKNGENGRGIFNVEEYYCVSSESSTYPEDSWTLAIPEMTEEKRYLWNYEKTIYTDGDIIETTPAVIGVYGAQGRGVKSVINYYLASSLKNGVYTSSEGWTETVQEISEEKKYLWNYETIIYTDDEITSTDPIIIGIFSKDGIDGRGISEVREYYQVGSTSNSAPTGVWETTVPEMTEENRFLWNYEEIIYTSGDPTSTAPAVIGVYGSQGRGISSIINYYLATSEQNGVDRNTRGWTETVQSIDSEKRYLWNYEQVNYTSGNPTYTDPVIIGAFGADGASAFVFEIYSQDGLVFKEDLTEIELKTIAYNGVTAVIGDSYQWSYMNSNVTTDIPGATSPSLIVSKNDAWAMSTIKCTMMYNGEQHDGYISLVDQVTIYDSEIKYFNGSNVFKTTDKYLISYMALYKNGEEIDPLPADQYAEATSVNTSTGVIITTVSGTFEINQLLYFVLPNTVYSNRYDIILGKYDGSNWKKVDISQEYVYKNSKEEQSKLMVISKSEVNKTLPIYFDVYSAENSKYLSHADSSIIDLNDPIVSGVEPTNAVDGQLWINTSRVPYVVKVCNIDIDGNVTWTDSNQQFGGAIYTSQPTSYLVNDIWVLNDNESCSYVKADGTAISYGPGSMLRSSSTSDVFVASHWSEIKSELTDMRDNVAQYFEFNSETGLKIGQKDQKFYVNISATEMGFYDNSNASRPNEKVVSIGNQAAKIKNITMEESATFSCDADFNNSINMYNPYSNNKTGFSWKIESDGSLSLVAIK
jgi:hypothetical protein